MKLDRIGKAYRSAAVVLFSVFAAFIALNFAIDYLPLLASLLRSPNPVAQKYGQSPLLRVYPGKRLEEIHSLLAETWSRPYAYEAFTQFKERPYAGRHVIVDGNGFRASSHQVSWPPRPADLNVFVFGGSTTFGYGVSDEETIASFLQDELRGLQGASVAVFNFGRGFYYSTQERILFEQLLVGGHIPHVAVFIDGLNEFSYQRDEPQFTPRLKAMFGSVTSMRSVVSFSKLPAVRLVKGWVRSWRGLAREDSADGLAAGGAYQEIVERYLSNKKLIEVIAEGYGVKPIFVWQPVPMYKYDLASHPFSVPDNDADVADGYRVMEAKRSRDGLGRNFLWCADIQEGRSEPLYVDQVHYTAAFSKAVAGCIAELMKGRGLLALQ